MQERPSGPPMTGQDRRIAISRLPPHKEHETHEKEERVARACKTCRRRKVRCSGDTPRCANCVRSDLVCVYDPARRDRLGEAMRLNQNLVSLLKDIGERANEEDQKVIREALRDVEDDLVSHDSIQSTKSLGKRNRRLSSSTEKATESKDHGEAFVTASVGSNEDLDILGEDLMRTRESRETGYFGQNSEVQWLRSVQRQAERGNTDPYEQRYGPPGGSQGAIDERSDALHERRENAVPGSMQHITDATFYLDSDDIQLDIAVDPYELPELETAEKLFECYLKTVHSTFPLMPMNFEDQFRRYIRSLSMKRPYSIPDKWRATMNLLFAIGAKYSHLTCADWRGDERDHLIYMTRAVHLLGLKDTVMFISAPNLDLVQATGALAFYFLVIGHVSRAWIMIGLSIRQALALGLHLRNEDPSLDDSKKEPLVRVWWCLHSIECLVSSITGRPPVIANEDCTVTLPSIRDGSSSHQASRVRTEYNSPPRSSRSDNSGSRRHSMDESPYLLTYVNLTLISQKVLLSLYSPRTAVQNWEYVQGKITELLNELEEWSKGALPEDHYPVSPSRRPELERERFLLKIYYWSSKVLITRPCLCRIERRISSESDKSVNFNTQAAETCVEAARQMANLFPEQPDLPFIYSQGPWWDVVHIIMQTMAVLLLEMAYEGKHLKEEKSDIVTCIKKMVRWLHAMRTNDPVASRAYAVVFKILKSCAPKLQEQVRDIIADDLESVPVFRSKPPAQPQNTAREPSPGMWNSSQYMDLPTVDHTDYAPHFYQDQPTDSIYSYPIDEPPTTGFTFGNPFFTSFDQGVPLVEMQDLWWNTAPIPHLDMNPSGMVMSQQHQMQQQMHQQMHEDGMADQSGHGGDQEYLHRQD